MNKNKDAANGIFIIDTVGYSKKLDVYCEMTLGGGGFTS